MAGDKKKWADAQEANKEPEGGSDTKATQKHVYALGEVLEMMDEEEYPEETAKLNEVHQELKRLSTSKGTGPFVTTLNESHEDAVYDEFENYFQNDLDEEETKVLNEVGACLLYTSDAADE